MSEAAEDVWELPSVFARSISPAGYLLRRDFADVRCFPDVGSSQMRNSWTWVLTKSNMYN
jgi:hypothetical protein